MKSSIPGTKRIEVRFFFPGNKTSKLHTLVAAPGKHWTPDGVDQVLANFVDQVDRDFPYEEYKLVELDLGRFNLVHVGERKLSMAAPTLGTITSEEIKRRALERAAAEQVPGDA